MRYRKRRPIRVPWKLLPRLFAVCLLAAAAVQGYRNMRDLVAVYGENRCRNLVVNSTAEAISRAETDEKLITFTTNENTNVLELNSAQARRFQTAVAAELTQRLENLGEQSHSVRLGTVLDSLLLMDRGPEIAFRFIPVGSVQVAVTSDLQDAGINQVLYRVVLQVDVDMTVLLPGGRRGVRCSQQIPVEEVVLSGDVPLVYGG